MQDCGHQYVMSTHKCIPQSIFMCYNVGMQIKHIRANISVIHANIMNRPLFEGEWPIPNGVTLNSYVVQGKKTALIDLTATWDEAVSSFNSGLGCCGGSKIDYVVLNHLEPDHSGYLKAFLEKHSEATVIATAKGCALVKDFLKASGEDVGAVRMQAVKDGDTLDLGGVSLEFYEIPFVHWPETMCTFERESGTLFSCDAFGGYGATGESIFDDEITDEEHQKLETESLRYYATIVSPFSASVKKAIDKITAAGLSVKTVAPSHGVVWRAHPETIINRYVRYAGYNTGGKEEREICVLCSSMYGNSTLGAEAVVRGIEKSGKGIKVAFIKIPDTDVSYALAAVLRAAAVVVAAPTCDYGLFPPMAYVLDLLKRKKMTGKLALRIGSFGWSGGAQREYDALIAPLKWQSVPSYEWKGVPSDEDIKTLEQLGETLASEAEKSLGA